MNSHDRAKLIRPLTKIERLILYEAGEDYGFINCRGGLPHLDSLMNFVMLCKTAGFHNTDHFWKEYRLLSEILKDTSGYYIHTPIPKKNGKGYRNIFKVSSDLAFYQRNIKTYILDHLDAKYTSPYAYAYKEGISICDNARMHAGHDHLVKMDIADFFDSTGQSKVYGVFSRYTPYNKAVKTFLTKLVCHNGHLSQGTCTSPQLANLVLAVFDQTVAEFCRPLGITYTRYCDDMTFSSDRPFDAKALIGFVTRQLELEHYRPNIRKTRVFGKGSRHIVTGIVVNNGRLRVPSEYKHNLRQDLYYIRKFGVTSHLMHKNIPGFGSIFTNSDKRHEESYLNMLIGRAEFACYVDPEDKELAEIRNELNGCLDKYASEFRDLYGRFIRFAGTICEKHILIRQDPRISFNLISSFYPYDGFTVSVAFKPKTGSEISAYRYLRHLFDKNDYRNLNIHQKKIHKDIEISFRIPVCEFASLESVLNSCLDELLSVYSSLRIEGLLPF